MSSQLKYFWDSKAWRKKGVLVTEKSMHVVHVIFGNSATLNIYQELVKLELHHLWVIYIVFGDLRNANLHLKILLMRLAITHICLSLLNVVSFGLLWSLWRSFRFGAACSLSLRVWFKFFYYERGHNFSKWKDRDWSLCFFLLTVFLALGKGVQFFSQNN